VSLTLYAHPFSSYCQKVLIGLYENGTAFTYRNLEDPGAGEELAKYTPTGKFPVLLDDGWPVFETSIIIEHLQLKHPGPVRLIPEDSDAALKVRLLDRMFDLHVMTPMQAVVANALRPADAKDPYGVDQAKAKLEQIYGWLDRELAGRTWAAGGDFSLADCAGAPSLFYADWVHEIGPDYPNLRAYRSRVLARPSVARCVEEARKYRSYFPLGAPDRD
jgi:glutathione S-transferase